MSEREWKNWILPGTLSLYAYLCLSYLLNLAAAPAGFTASAFSVLLLPLLVCFWARVWREFQGMENRKQRRRRAVFVLGTGALLGLTFVLGYQIRVLGMTSLGYKGKLLILILSAGLGVAFSPFVNAWFRLLDGWKCTEEKQGGGFSPGKCFWVCWLGIFVCWLPVFLAYYPAIMSYDFHRQCEEAVKGFIWFNSYQPLIHTLLIWLFLRIGGALQSYEIGMALFSLTQMLLLSAVLAYSCSMLGRLCQKKTPTVVACALFALLPIHPVLAMSMTKDILFSAFFLLTLLLLLERRFAFLSRKRKGVLILLDAGMVLSAVVSILFRNNAIYAYAVFAVFYVIWSKGERLKIGLLCAAILLGGYGAREGLLAALGAGRGSNVEMCSVIIQTVGRTGKNHASSMTQEQLFYCEYIVGDCSNYNPTISDSLKNNVANTTYPVWEKEPARMLEYWFKLGAAFPNDYIDAVLALTSGYWFLDDVSHAEVLGYGDDTNLGLLYTFNASKNKSFDGVESRSFFPELLKAYSHIVNGNAYYRLPVLSVLFKPAFYCWALIVVMISLVYRRQYRKLVLCMLPFWYLMTLFLGPVVNMRYVYPMIVTTPVLLGWLFSGKDWNRNEDVTEKG